MPVLSPMRDTCAGKEARNWPALYSSHTGAEEEWNALPFASAHEKLVGVRHYRILVSTQRIFALKVMWKRAEEEERSGRWARAREIFAEIAGRFGDSKAREREISMLRLCGRFSEAARLAQAHGLDTPDAALAEIARRRGLDEARVAALFERVGAFLRARRLPVLGTSVSVVAADDEQLIEAVFFTPSREPLDEAFVDYMSRFDPMPKEEATILIGFEPADGDALARSA